MRIAIYQSAPDEANRIGELLSLKGHKIFLQTSRYDLISLLDHSTMDLVVTEWHGMVIRDNISSHWLIREAKKTAVLFTTTEANVTSLPMLLSSNAIDFVCIPIDDDQFLLRIDVLLRRAYPHMAASSSRLDVGPYSLDVIRRTIRYDGVELEKVNDRFFKLAFCLFANLGRPLSRDYLRKH